VERSLERRHFGVQAPVCRRHVGVIYFASLEDAAGAERHRIYSSAGLAVGEGAHLNFIGLVGHDIEILFHEHLDRGGRMAVGLEAATY
jgi:hypothetical protein